MQAHPLLCARRITRFLERGPDAGEYGTVTNVAPLREDLRAVLPDGTKTSAKLIRRSESLQTALIQLVSPWPHYFELSEKPNVLKGDWICAVANPFKVADGAESLSVNLGIVSMRLSLDAKR